MFLHELQHRINERKNLNNIDSRFQGYTVVELRTGFCLKSDS